MERGVETWFQTFSSYSIVSRGKRFYGETVRNWPKELSMTTTRTFEHFVQVLHLDGASHDRLTILKVLFWRLHVAIQRHVQNDELHVGGGHALSKVTDMKKKTSYKGPERGREMEIRTWVGR
jgi:hypothetical protein